ncbi:Kinesin light chain 3 [Physocladia obscura]|uniref:Kinesin light chain 3 n=1 Tax=Physocladia obscura TaxID=109957 RepID=A0AAD5XET4_9FUNG|nr:Kinesin light chain 3 [Physocladia obscura]
MALSFTAILIILKSWGGTDAVEGLTTTEVCQSFILPMTCETRLSLVEQLQNDPIYNNLVKEATFFFSHAWEFKFRDLLHSIESFIREQNLNPDKTFIWLDIFSTSQHDFNEKSFEWLAYTFQQTIAKIGNLVLVMLPWSDPLPLKRAWCVYEIYASVKSNSKFYVALPPNEQETFIESIMADNLTFYEILKYSNSEVSHCQHQSDQDEIFNVIRRSIGFSKLDQLVFSTFFNWIVNLSESKLAKASSNEEKCAWLAALGNFHYENGSSNAAEQYFSRAYETCKLVFGDTHKQTLQAMNNLAAFLNSLEKFDESKNLSENCIKINTSGKSTEEYIEALGNIAAVYQNTADYKKAEELYLLALNGVKQINADSRKKYIYMSRLATAYRYQGKYNEAKEMVVEAIDGFCRLLGPVHPETLGAQLELGNLLIKLENYEECERILSESIEICKKGIGEAHTITDSLEVLLGSCFLYQDKLAEAEPLLVRSFNFKRQFIGSMNSNTLVAMNQLSLLYRKMKKFSEAELLMVECVAGFRKTITESHPNTLTSIFNLALIYQSLEKYDEAENMYKEALDGMRKVHGDSHLSSLHVMQAFADFYFKTRRYQESEEMLSLCIEKTLAVLDKSHAVAIKRIQELEKVREFRKQLIQRLESHESEKQ